MREMIRIKIMTGSEVGMLFDAGLGACFFARYDVGRSGRDC